LSITLAKINNLY